MKRIFLISILTIVFLYNLSAQNKIPRLFKLDWGITYSQVSDKILNKDVALSPLKHYPIYKGKSELDDIKLSSFVKYQSEGSPFFDIPSTVIFTFYNPDNLKNRLQLSKVEVYLSKKDNYRLTIDTKSVYKNLISIFCENYGVDLKLDDERNIFTTYSYQITLNGIHAIFTANIGDNILDNNEAIFFSYESNHYQNLILKKEIDLLKEKDNIKDKTNNKDDINIKSNL